MKKIFGSFIAVCAVFMLGTAQQAMANNEPANEPAKVETPRLVHKAYYDGTVGSNLKITMFLERYSNGDYRGWYYYNKYGASNKLVLVGKTDYEGNVELLEFTKDGQLTAGFEGRFNNNGEFVGEMFVVHNNKHFTCKLTPKNN